MCYGLAHESKNNIQRRSIFENTTIHNSHKGC
jgi:hypothetical protein